MEEGIVHGRMRGGKIPFEARVWIEQLQRVNEAAAALLTRETGHERLGITVAQLAVAWVLANPAVDVAIVGARRPQQLVETAPAADVQLSQETLAEIEGIMQIAVPMGGPSPEGMI